MKSEIVLILGSSRSDGDTMEICERLCKLQGFDLIDLNAYNISYYDYENKNRNDDFLKLLEKIVTDYKTIVFATPIYWYTMSAQIKTFLDRITDALTIEKDTGRKLRGKNMGILSCSLGAKSVKGFEEPFRLTAEYLDMKFLGYTHFSSLENTSEITTFANKLIQDS